MHDREGRYVVLTLEQVGFLFHHFLTDSPSHVLTTPQLLPMSFGPDSLPPPDELDKARQEMGEK